MRGARFRPVDESHFRESSLFCLLLSGFLFCVVAAETLGGSLLWLGYAFACGLALILTQRHARGRLVWPSELRLLAAFVAWSLTTGLFMTTGLAQYIQTAQRLVLIAILISMVACYCASVRSPLPVLVAILILGLVLVAYGVLTGDFQMGGQVTHGGARVIGYRSSSLAGNPNAFGMTCIWSLATVAILGGIMRRRSAKVLVVSVVPALMGGVAYSGSRKAVVLVFVFAAAYLWLCYRRLVLRRIGALVGVLVVVSVVVVFARYVLRGTFVEQRLSLAAAGEDDSTVVRRLLILEACRVFAEHPVAGIGLGEYVNTSEFKRYTHNEYLEIASSTGLVGAALYFGIYVSVWRRLSRVRRTAGAARLRHLAGASQALFVAFMAANMAMVVYSSFSAMALFGGLLGFAYGADREGRRTVAKNLASYQARRAHPLRPPFAQPAIRPRRGPFPA